MNRWLDFIRGITRPFCTILLVGVLCKVVLDIVGKMEVPSLPEAVFVGLIVAFTTTVSTVIAFWFGSRNRPVQ